MLGAQHCKVHGEAPVGATQLSQRSPQGEMFVFTSFFIACLYKPGTQIVLHYYLLHYSVVFFFCRILASPPLHCDQGQTLPETQERDPRQEILPEGAGESPQDSLQELLQVGGTAGRPQGQARARRQGRRRQRRRNPALVRTCCTSVVIHTSPS